MKEKRFLLEPDGIWVSFREGDTVGDALSAAGVVIDRPCAGQGRCGKCRVRIRNGAPPTPAEEAVISQEELVAGWRLSCVTPARSGIAVWKPERAAVRILSGAEEDGRGLVHLDSCMLGCDIGTTTVVLYLLHPRENRILHTVSAMNGQIAFGGDVISRIHAVYEDMDNLRQLQTQIVSTLNHLIARMAAETGMDMKKATVLRVAGNTTMEHLLLGVDPRGLGRSPFTPAFLAAPDRPARELGLDLGETAVVSVVENLSAFVGGDITAGIYHTRMYRQEGLYLLLDIGTNNEMVLGSEKGMWACSAAAGPALEGAQISTGMRAAEGAVEKVWCEEGMLCLRTIGNAPPVGICGSGLIDILAVLFQQGVILPSGRFASPGKLPQGDLASRLQKDEKGHTEFVYCRAGEHGAAQELTLTQKDVRETQLAKSAISVGISKLLERFHARVEDLDAVYLAGAFGNYVDCRNARILGILPPVAEHVIQPVRNAAGLGVCESFYDPEVRAELGKISSLCQTLNLAEEPDFQERFMERLAFSALEV